MMDLAELLRRRHMTRSFGPEPVDQALLDELCELALYAPTAGNSAGVRMTTLAGDQVSEYLRVATDESWRANSPRYAGLARAGAVVIVTSRPQDYLERYAQPDKAASGLSDLAAWSVPYWHTDAAMATMSLLLLLEERRLGAALWGSFRRQSEVLAWAGVVDELLFATVLVGVGDGGDHPSSSLAREVTPRRERVRRVARGTTRGPTR
jgi:nitroreductase